VASIATDDDAPRANVGRGRQEIGGEAGRSLADDETIHALRSGPESSPNPSRAELEASDEPGSQRGVGIGARGIEESLDLGPSGRVGVGGQPGECSGAGIGVRRASHPPILPNRR
jgi:hypothetical protein